MEEKVLAAYGSANGSTRGIAETVAGVLRVAGLTAEVPPARSVTEPTPYEAVVVGGALCAGRRHEDARRHGAPVNRSRGTVRRARHRETGCRGTVTTAYEPRAWAPGRPDPAGA
ncbi:hypothetical protein [Streptomyces sp. NPDC059781]|uniref:hypothetical protein n=1 Tax=unclassified Streptomyces TaxID=2593676 RepID=UPI003651DED1